MTLCFNQSIVHGSNIMIDNITHPTKITVTMRTGESSDSTERKK